MFTELSLRWRFSQGNKPSRHPRIANSLISVPAASSHASLLKWPQERLRDPLKCDRLVTWRGGFSGQHVVCKVFLGGHVPGREVSGHHDPEAVGRSGLPDPECRGALPHHRWETTWRRSKIKKWQSSAFLIVQWCNTSQSRSEYDFSTIWFVLLRTMRTLCWIVNCHWGTAPLFVPPVAAVNRGWSKSYCFASLYQRSETSFPADTTERDFNSGDALISPVFCLLIRMTAVGKRSSR